MWRRALRAPHGRRALASRAWLSERTFEALPLRPEVQRAVARLGFNTLSRSQDSYADALLSRADDLLVRAPTGSGKTLMYLLPLIESALSRPDAPGVVGLVVVPTRELALQVYRVACALVEDLPVRVSYVTESARDTDTAALASTNLAVKFWLSKFAARLYLSVFCKCVL